jgi:hypothetical protein
MHSSHTLIYTAHTLTHASHKQAFADEHGLDFLETSAKKGTNVERAFTQTAAAVCQKVKSHQIDVTDPRSGVKLNKELADNQRGGKKTVGSSRNERISVGNAGGGGGKGKKKGCC